MPDLPEELLGAGPEAEAETPWAPEEEGDGASLEDTPRPEEEDFTSPPPRASLLLASLREEPDPPPPPLPPVLPLLLAPPLAAPFLSLSLLKNLNLSNIEFLLPDDEDDVEAGLDDELFDDEVEDVELALVRLDCLSPPEAGRPRPKGVGMPEGGGAAPGEVERDWDPPLSRPEAPPFGGASSDPEAGFCWLAWDRPPLSPEGVAAPWFRLLLREFCWELSRTELSLVSDPDPDPDPALPLC